MSNFIDNNPWAGLSSYEDPEKAQREGRKPKMFCGRDVESHNVAQLIAGNIFVTLYGKSGTGKTSLLNAGVFPRLRQKRYLPISIRLSMDAMDISFQQCIIRQLSQTLGIANGQQQTVNVVPMSTDEQQPDYLWSFFARTRFTDSENRTLFPVIVFDQFEEIFRNRRNEAEVLLRQIAYLMDESHALSPRLVDDMPYKYDFNFRFVVSIREDDLYRLEDSIDNNYLAELKRCRYRLHSLSEEGARDAILIPGEGLFAEEEQIDIVAAIIEKSKNEDGSNSTNIISLLCSRIFVEYQKSQADHITFSLVENFIKGNPFERFYNEATLGFSNKEKSYIEDHLVDSTGRRNSIPESDFLLHVKKGQKLLEGDNHILQRASTSSGSGNIRIELIHDSFCKPIANQKEKREKTRRTNLIISLISSFLIFVGVVYCIINSFTERQNKMLLNQSRFISEKANELVDEGDSYTACLLALSVLPENLKSPNRPYATEAEGALRKALMDQRGCLKGHTSWVNFATYSHKGDKIVSSSNDGTIRVWESKSGACLHVLKGHAGGVNHASFSQDGTKIVSSSADSTIRIWDAITGVTLQILKCPADYSEFSPDGKYIVSIAYNNNTIQIWDATNCKKILTLKGHNDNLSAVSFSPNSKNVLSASDDGTIKIWDIKEGNVLKTLKGHQGRVITATYSSDSKKVVSYSDDCTLRIWDNLTGKEIKVYEGVGNHLMTLSPDGMKIAFDYSESIRIFDFESGMKINSLSKGYKMGIKFIQFSPDGREIISGGWENEIRIWPLKEACKKIIRTNLLSGIHTLAVNGDCRTVAAVGSDSILEIWDIVSSRKLCTLKGHQDYIRSVEFCPFENKILSTSNDNTVRIWDIKTGRQLYKWEGWLAEYSTDGKQIISLSDSTIRITDSKTGLLLNKYTKSEFKYIRCFSRNCKNVIILDSVSNKFYIKDIETRKIIRSFEKPLLISAKFSHDENRIVAISLDGTNIWDVKTGEVISSNITTGFWGLKIWFVNFSPDGQKIISKSSIDNSFSLWDCQTEKLLLKLKNDKEGHAIFSPDGKLIISTDGRFIKVWDFPPLQELIDKTTERFRNRQLTPEERRHYYLE